MPLYVAPAGMGKTTYVLQRAHETADHWGIARVVVGSGRQARAGYRYLAQIGSLGVRLHTLSGLARELLDRAGQPCIVISDPIQIRFLRAITDQTPLTYYRPLVRMPGFIRSLRDLFRELILAQITPHDFAQQAQTVGPRLTELAQIYTHYRQALATRGWTDAAGLTTCALQALHQHPHLAQDWPFLAVDGFPRFQAADLALLRELAQRVDTFIITMTGEVATQDNPSQTPLWENIQQVLSLIHI